MTSNWPENKDIKSICDFANWLAKTSQHPERVYRGQARHCWRLQPSLDRDVPETDCFKDRVPKEKEYIEDFCNQARPFLDQLERDYLVNPFDRVLRMTVMQHYGAPTRLLDWTRSAAIAAYFASVDERHLDGTIWWINDAEVAAWLHCRWKGWGYPRRKGDGQIVVDYRIDDPTVPPFVSMTHLPGPFGRVKAQCGLFTFGSQPGLAHDDQLQKQLKVGSYGRVVIPAKLKCEVVQCLERLKIDAKSLQHAGADRVGLRMAWDREHGN